MKYKFPKDFLWGVATSGYQTEGNGTNTDWWFHETHKKQTDKSSSMFSSSLSVGQV